MTGQITGRVYGIQSLGTVDGPGVRFVAFLQGCPLRCDCCHNPDTQPLEGGREYTADDLVKLAVRYRSYFGEKGGITLSGGEPLCQPAFVEAVFARCHREGIHTCLDTAGYRLDQATMAALAHTDRVLLDVKYTDAALYEKHVGCRMEAVLAFLQHLNRQNIPTTLRQVIIPTVNDTEENICRLGALAKATPCVDGVELLPFRKLCQTKYDALGRPFPFGHLPTPDEQQMSRLRERLKAEMA